MLQIVHVEEVKLLTGLPQEVVEVERELPTSGRRVQGCRWWLNPNNRNRGGAIHRRIK